jgi:hypothetical protein
MGNDRLWYPHPFDIRFMSTLEIIFFSGEIFFPFRETGSTSDELSNPLEIINKLNISIDYY